MAIGADYPFEHISIVHWVPQFIRDNKIFLGSVIKYELQNYTGVALALIWHDTYYIISMPEKNGLFQGRKRTFKNVQKFWN